MRREQRSYVESVPTARMIDSLFGFVDSLFEFEEKKLPLPVLLATAALIAIFAVGIPYRVFVGLF